MLDLILNKIITKDALSGILNSGFRKKNKLAFTNGCFDILHRGHIYYLSLAKERADILIVGLNSDESVSRLKGPDRPVQDQQTRAERILPASGPQTLPRVQRPDAPQFLQRSSDQVSRPTWMSER